MTPGFENTATPHEQPEVWQFSLRSAFIAIALVALLMAFVHYALQAVAEGKRSETATSFRYILIALHNWEATYGRLPYPVENTHNIDSSSLAYQNNAKVTPLYSWRFTIILCIASYGREATFNYPWNSPESHFWRSVAQPYAYEAWGTGMGGSRNATSTPTNTRVFAITGPGTAFGDGNTEQPQRLQDIDGDTILLVEVRNSGIHWMQPGDFDIRTMPKTINDATGKGISSHHATGFHVAFADGSVWYMQNNVPFEELAKFFTVAGAKENDREILLKPYKYR